MDDRRQVVDAGVRVTRNVVGAGAYGVRAADLVHDQRRFVAEAFP